MTAQKTILILGNSKDEHAAFVNAQLQQRGARCEYLDMKDFPRSIQMSLYPERGEGRLKTATGINIALTDVHSIYWRNYNKAPSLYRAPIQDPEMAFVAENDSRSVVESFLMNRQFKWVNGWEGFELHQRKPYALAKVAKMGVQVPRTICSNDPIALKEFFANEQNVIFKPIQGGTHTERLRPEALSDENLINLELGPVTFQEEIIGTNIRVFVAGERVFACEVRTSEVDFRDDRRPEISAFPLTPAMTEQSLQIAKALGLVWTGIDYRLSQEGEFVFLEANPSPMFMGFEKASGLPLGAALLDLLMD